MQPCGQWRLYIDETGSKFAGQAGTHTEVGRFVVVAHRAFEQLECPGVPADFHAVEESPECVASALAGVLLRRVGLLGVSAPCLPDTHHRNYDAGLYATVLLALRLLPLPPTGPVRVEVIAEERGTRKDASYWKGVAHALQRELHLGDPARAARMAIELTDVAKGEAVGTAMADVVAYCWATTRAETATLRRRWGQVEACLLQDPRSAETMRRALGALRPGRALPVADWLELLEQADDHQPGGPVRALLDRLARDARSEPSVFAAYLEAARRSLDAKGYDLRLLQRQAAWLADAAPAGWTPPPRLALLQGMHVLATGNHAGHTGAEQEDAVLDLVEQVWDEDVRLAALAALHVAVRRTNAYDFVGASAALEGLVELPQVALGPNLSGRLWSSLGQHAAFQADTDSAVSAFDTALAAFDRISDPEERRRERAQTLTYRALALLDGDDEAAARDAVGVLVGGLKPNTIRSVARGGDGADRWGHHALVRFLAERGTADEVAAYCSEHRKWGAGRNHPWALIETYRAVLLAGTDGEAARASVRRALAALAGAPGTLAIIRAAIERVAIRLGETPEHQTDIASLRGSVPAAAPWLERLASLSEDGDPLAPLRVTLPFNFR